MFLVLRSNNRWGLNVKMWAKSSLGACPYSEVDVVIGQRAAISSSLGSPVYCRPVTYTDECLNSFYCRFTQRIPAVTFFPAPPRHTLAVEMTLLSLIDCDIMQPECVFKRTTIMWSPSLQMQHDLFVCSRWSNMKPPCVSSSGYLEHTGTPPSWI